MLYYIDPGTGSMLFTILIGAISAGIYALRNVFLKLRFKMSGGKVEDIDKAVPFAIFSDSKRYWNLFEPICDEFEKRETPVVYMTASPDDPALQKDYKFAKCEFIGEGNKAFAKLNMYKADVLLSTTPGLDVYQWKRSRDVKWYIHILHCLGNATGYRMFGTDYFDAMLLSGEFQVEQIETLESLRNIKVKEKIITGIPYVDEMKKRLDSLPKQESSEITVLLAPTWGASGILKKYGEKMIDALIATGYNIVIRPHPQSFVSEKDLMDKLMKLYPETDKLHWNRDNDNFDILSKSDIMISDFSGVIFDFSLVFDKPIIYADTSYDSSPYDTSWVEKEPWTFSTLPYLGQQLTEDKIDNIKDVIDNCINDSKYEEGRKKARSEVWANEGHSAEAVVDYMIKKQKEIVGED